MANKTHCDICNKTLTLKLVPEIGSWFGTNYEFIERSSIWPPMSVLMSPSSKKKLDVCNECFGDFKEFVERKKSYKNP